MKGPEVLVYVYFNKQVFQKQSRYWVIYNVTVFMNIVYGF